MSTRQLTDHKVNGLNEALRIEVMDTPGAGGANHHYMVTLPDWTRSPDGSNPHHVWDIQFQNGPINESGFNGISNEALLAILIDRMRGFQSGPYASRDNAVALTKMEEALMWLQKRTRDRMARGVEGAHKV